LDSKRNILTESVIFFSERIKDLNNQGVHDIIIDPGFGFDKTLEENFRLLNNLEMLQILEKPILVGISRKSMIYKKIEINPEESLNGTTILNTTTFLKGASVFRVHDVLEMNQIRQLLNSNT
jgi:dihydropteroate synthase